MNSEIIERHIVELDESKTRMVASGWGKNVIEDSVVEKITYLSDGLKIKGYIAYPKNQSEKYPCIIWNRGGLGELGVIDKFNARGIFGLIASWGYVVLASQYRGNDGGDGVEEFGGRDLNDVMNLIPIAEKIPNADTSRWGIEGWSRGGLMTYLLLMRTNMFKAAITVGGVCNLRCHEKQSKFIESLVKRTFGHLSEEKKMEFCKERSVINFAEKITTETPLMIIHNFHVESVSISPDEAYSPLVVNSNTVLSLTVSFKGLEPIARRGSQVAQLRGTVKHGQFSVCGA